MTVEADGVALLEQAVGYGMHSVEAVTTRSLPRRTPCAGWDLRMLLLHVNDSLGALQEGFDTGCAGLPGDGAGEPEDVAGDTQLGSTDLVSAFRVRTRRLLAGCERARGIGGREIGVAGHSIPADVAAIVGAIEIAVHGWGISVACGQYRPIPADLATGVIHLARLLVDSSVRRSLFAAPVTVPPQASPSDRLVAFLGRRPRG